MGGLADIAAKAREIRQAYERGEIGDDARMEQLAELRRPKGFWSRISWALFGI